MAAASVTVSCARGTIRVYGGNRGDVRYMAKRYCEMDLVEFLKKHKYLTPLDYQTLHVSSRYNK